MEVRDATRLDVQGIIELHQLYHLSTIQEDDKKDGFISASFSSEELLHLIEQENGICVAVVNEKIIAYAMTASWAFWAKWPMISYLEQELPNLKVDNKSITVSNSCQYGPVCIHKNFRGQGVLETLYAFCQDKAAPKYDYFVTLISRHNPRSYQAHVRKTNLNVVTEFNFNGNSYYELIGLTRAS